MKARSPPVCRVLHRPVVSLHSKLGRPEGWFLPESLASQGGILPAWRQLCGVAWASRDLHKCLALVADGELRTGRTRPEMVPLWLLRAPRVFSLCTGLPYHNAVPRLPATGKLKTDVQSRVTRDFHKLRFFSSFLSFL